MQAVEEIADQMLQTRTTVSLFSRNIALYAIKLAQPSDFRDVNCTAYLPSANPSQASKDYDSESFVCGMPSPGLPSLDNNMKNINRVWPDLFF